MWRKDFLFHITYLSKKTQILAYVFEWVYFTQFFFVYQSPSLSLRMVFDAVSSNIDKILWINPSANVFVFGDFNIHCKDWLTFSGGTDRAGELCYSFEMILIRLLTFLLWSLAVTLTVLLFGKLYIQLVKCARVHNPNFTDLFKKHYIIKTLATIEWWN